MRHKLSQDAGCEWVPCGKFGLNSRHEQRGLKRRPEGSVRIVLIPLVLVAIFRHHCRCYGWT